MKKIKRLILKFKFKYACFKVDKDKIKLAKLKKESEKLNDLYKRLEKDRETNKKCPLCGSTLYIADSYEYSYICSGCAKEFYNIEIE